MTTPASLTRQQYRSLIESMDLGVDFGDIRGIRFGTDGIRFSVAVRGADGKHQSRYGELVKRDVHIPITDA